MLTELEPLTFAFEMLVLLAQTWFLIFIIFVNLVDKNLLHFKKICVYLITGKVENLSSYGYQPLISVKNIYFLLRIVHPCTLLIYPFKASIYRLLLPKYSMFTVKSSELVEKVIQNLVTQK